MPKVTMTQTISGTRNGQAWPKPGGTIEVSASEAEGLVNLGMATTETAPPQERQETRTVEPAKTADKPPRKSAAKKG